MHRFRSLALLTAMSVVGALTLTTIGSSLTVAATDDPSQPRRASMRVAMDSADALDFWTPERMARAKPLTSLRNRNDPRVRVSRETLRKPRRLEGIGVPDDQAGRVIKAAQQQPSAVYPYPFGRRALEKQLWGVAPYKTVGRLFFRQNGVAYSCSGASVVGGPRNVVFTAGHCLKDLPPPAGTGAWSKDVVFVPGRRPGKKKNPYGRFVAKDLWVPGGWSDEDKGWFPYDLGAFNVGRNGKGKTLRKAVGALGFAYGEGRIQHFDLFGYPALPPFGGNRPITCAAAHAVDDADPNGPDPIGVGCDMDAGASGGPWIIRLRRGNFLNGVTSYGYSDQPGALYSPYFDETANKLRCAAATGNENATTC